MIFRADAAAVLGGTYPDAPAALRHDLSGHCLLTLDRLIALAATLPARAIEYNAGDLAVGQDPALTPGNGLGSEETLRRIAERRSWLALKNVEQNAAYKDLLEDCLSEIAGAAAARTGAMYNRQGFIFISSPGAVTPFHMDPEHNILLQIRGRKTMRVFPAGDPALAPPERHEAFHKEGGHRNLPYREEFETHAQVFELAPGDAVYVPVKAPHWVRVGDDVSVSLSITWRSRASDNEARLYRANAWLRARGAAPPFAGVAPLRDAVKICAARIAARLPRG